MLLEWIASAGLRMYTAINLRNRGWSAADVRKVLGENWLRVYEQALGG